MVGSVPASAGNLHSELESLRSIALQLAPSKFSVKLYAERSHVSFGSLEPGLEGAARLSEEEISAEVVQKYVPDPKEQAFDWCATDNLVQVATISRDYLIEMERFAVDNRFNPVCFAALSNRNEFKGEPLFGMTATAGKILGIGTAIEREIESPKILGVSEDWEVVQ